MFQSPTHLPQLLPPDAYRSPDRYAVEFERLFKRGWHLVCTTADLPRAGDYVTLDIGSIPLLVRNVGGEIEAYLNVCPHRFCQIASDPVGHTETFCCQYHGWEFDATGETRRIPDAPSFKPMSKGQFCLTRYRTAMCGQLVFVSLEAGGDDLRGFLGGAYDGYARFFSDRYEQVIASDMISDSDWKIGVENGLESYHVSCVHSSTFGITPPAEDCIHELYPDHTLFRSITRSQPAFLRWMEERFARSAMETPTHDYVNVRTYPSLTYSRTDTVTFVQSILPVGPGRSRHVYRLFMPRPGRDPFDRLLHRWLRPRLAAYWRAVFAEDHVILPRIQRGCNASVHPGTGVVSSREERIFHFQRHVLDRCGLSEATPGRDQGDS
ncbi:MAG: aromatic ring-hydroxylating dioxygenase subunit alpha [Planctomycetota bacterium]|nr:MAG: aromatic ring-hydroxylating dioxygenase subunit alpha [Planctomycetota bacterium]